MPFNGGIESRLWRTNEFLTITVKLKGPQSGIFSVLDNNETLWLHCTVSTSIIFLMANVHKTANLKCKVKNIFCIYTSCSELQEIKSSLYNSEFFSLCLPREENNIHFHPV